MQLSKSYFFFMHTNITCCVISYLLPTKMWDSTNSHWLAWLITMLGSRHICLAVSPDTVFRWAMRCSAAMSAQCRTSSISVVYPDGRHPNAQWQKHPVCASICHALLVINDHLRVWDCARSPLCEHWPEYIDMRETRTPRQSYQCEPRNMIHCGVQKEGREMFDLSNGWLMGMPHALYDTSEN